MKKIGEFIKRQPEKPSARVTERGELLKFFSQKMQMPIPRVARHLGHLKELKDLYYLKSECEQAEKRGIPFGAAWWTGITIKKDEKK